MIGDYLDLNWRTLDYWSDWTERQREGQIVRVWRDYAREKQAIHAERERRLAQMAWRTASRRTA